MALTPTTLADQPRRRARTRRCISFDRSEVIAGRVPAPNLWHKQKARERDRRTVVPGIEPRHPHKHSLHYRLPCQFRGRYPSDASSFRRHRLNRRPHYLPRTRTAQSCCRQRPPLHCPRLSLHLHRPCFHLPLKRVPPGTQSLPTAKTRLRTWARPLSSHWRNQRQCENLWLSETILNQGT